MGKATFRIEKSADSIKLAPRRSMRISRCRVVIVSASFGRSSMVSDGVIERFS
jgi:hypothetical protein